MSSVVRPGAEQVDDLPLARGQRALDRPQPVEALGPAAEVLDQEALDAARHRRLAVDHAGQHPRQRLEVDLLRQEAARAGPQGEQRGPHVLLAGEHDDPLRRPPAARIARVASHAVQAEEGDVRLVLEHELDRLGRGARLGDDGDPGVLRARCRSGGGRAGRRRRRRCGRMARHGSAMGGMAPTLSTADWRIVGPSLGATRPRLPSSTRATCSGSSQVGTWPQPVSVTWRALGSRRFARALWRE